MSIDYCTPLCAAAASQSGLFQEVWQTVKDNFFDPKLRGVDWAARQSYGKEAEEAPSTEEFASVVNRMIVGSTAGAVMAGRPFVMSDGSLLYIAVNDALLDGKRPESNGVVPDVESLFHFHMPKEPICRRPRQSG